MRESALEEIIDDEILHKERKLWSPFLYAVYYNAQDVVEMFLKEEPFSKMYDSIILKRPPQNNQDFHLL